MNDSYRGRNRWQERRLGRRPLFGVGLAGGAAFAAACSDSNKDANTRSAATTDSSAAGEPKRGGTFRYVGLNVDAMDPATASSFPLSHTVYEALAVWNQTEQKASQHLASGWEQPDTSTIVFHMDPAARWQEKAPLSKRKVTSQDVKYTFNYYNSPDPKFQWKSDLAGLDLSRTETPDDATLVVHLKTASVAQLPNLLTGFRLYVLPHEVVERDGSLDKEALGSGPFLVESYVQNGAVRLVRNPTYWKSGLPYLDDVQSLPIKDVAAQLNAFLTGNLEKLQSLSVDQVKEVTKTAHVVKAGTWGWSGLTFNRTRKPFDDVRVRRALHLAIDRDAINQIAWDGNSEPSAAVVPAYGKWALPKAELLQQPGYRQPKDSDLAEAKKLLEAAGVKDLAVTVVSANASKSIWEVPTVALVDQLARIGVKVTPDIQDFPNYGRSRVAGDFALLGDAQAGPGDPDTTLRQAYHTSGGRNYGKYSNPQVDALMDKQALEVDVDKRVQLIHDLQRLLLTDMPVAVYCGQIQITALQPSVQGVAEWVGPVALTDSYALGQTAWLDK